MNKLLKNSAIYALGDLVPKICSFLLFPILTKHLAPEEYAVVNYVSTVNIFLTILGFLCLNTYYLVFYYRVGDEEEQKKLLGNLSIFVISLNLLLTIILFLVGRPFFLALGSNVSFYPFIAIGVVTNFFNILAVLPLANFRVRETPLPLAIINIIRGVLVLGLTALFVVRFNAKIMGVLYTNLIVSGVFGVFYIYITAKNSIWIIDFKQIKEALLFSIPLVPGSLAYNMVSLSDRILIDKYVSLEQLGIYSTASTLAMILNLVANSAYKAFEPYFFKSYGSDNYNVNFSKVRDYLLAGIFIGGFCLSLFSKEFFVIFASESYNGAYIFVPIITIGVIANAIQLMYATHLTAKGKTKINAGVTIFSGILSVMLNIMLLPRIGIISAASVFAISFVVSLSMSIYFAHIDITHVKPIVTSVLLSTLMVLCSWYIDIDNLVISILIKGFVVVCVAFLLVVIFKLDIKSLLKTNKSDNGKILS